MSETKTRRKFSPEEKAAILRRHLQDKIQVSDLCDEYKIQPSVFYTWQRQMIENMAKALEPSSGKRKSAHEAKLKGKISALEEKLAKKDNIIAEISEEYVNLKKELGDL